MRPREAEAQGEEGAQVKKPKFLRIIVEVPEGVGDDKWQVSFVRLFEPFKFSHTLARIVSVTAAREPKRKPAKRGRSKK